MTNIEEGFHYHEFSPEIHDEQIHVLNKNHILFVINGSIQVDCGEQGKVLIKEKEMFFISKSYSVKFNILENSSLLVAGFDLIQGNCNKMCYNYLSKFTGNINYNMKSFPIKYPLMEFLNLLVLYLKNKINCTHIHRLKIEEMFMCFRFFYAKEELAEFFYPILGNSMDFKDLLLSSCLEAKSVHDLVVKSGMGKTVFYEKFNKEFGNISPKIWLNQRISEKIFHIASDPEINVNRLAIQSGFDSFQQLQQYCKRYIGATPSEIIQERSPL